IGTMNRTRAMGPPTAPRDLALSTAPPRSAFRVTARVALDAAFLEHEGLAALRALRIQAFPQQLRGVAALLLHLDVRLDRPAELVVRLDGRLDTGPLHPDVPLDRLRDRVRDRVDALPVVDRDPRAADALELVDDLVDRDAGPQAQGNEARDAFREGGSISAAAADLREHFEGAFLVLVDRGVTPVLERRLHANMPFRRDVVSGREDPLPLIRDLFQAPRRAVVVEDHLHEIVTPESLALRDFLKVVAEIRQLLAVHDALVP